MNTRTKTCSLLALLASALPAQISPLIGYTARSAAPAESSVTRQSICRPPVEVCRTALTAPTVGYAGGSVYGHARSSIWHTDGNTLLEQSLPGCRTLCKTVATKELGSRSVLGGLTAAPDQRELIHVESIPNIAAIVRYRVPINGGCPRRVAACRFSLGGGLRPGAIAWDGNRDVLYVAVSNFSGPLPNNQLWIFRRVSGGGCVRICTIPAPSCFGGALGRIQAMTYDRCEDHLYVSDGRQTSVMRVVWPASSRCPAMTFRACCALNHPNSELWHGFDLLRAEPRQLGGSCTARPCAACPSLRLTTTGAPTGGNPDFTWNIQNAPAGSTGYVALSAGGCTTGFPFACGTFLPTIGPGLIVLPGVPLNGTGTCGGNGRVRTGLPTACGALLCAQGLVVCPGGGLGLTNALVVPISP